MIRVHVVAPKPIVPRVAGVRMREVERRVAQGLLDQWRRWMLRGTMPDGRSLPRNKSGLLLGIGRGTIIAGWSVRSWGRGVAIVPFQGGRYRIAVAMLVARGVVYYSRRGPSRALWRRLVKAEARRLRDRIGGTVRR